MVKEPPLRLQYVQNGQLMIIFSSGEITLKSFERKCRKNCGNGECFYSENVAKCVCISGFTGDKCETMLETCDNVGTESIRNHTCTCKKLYFGKFCKYYFKQKNRNTCINHYNIKGYNLYSNISFKMSQTFITSGITFVYNNGISYIIGRYFVAIKNNKILVFTHFKLQKVIDVIYDNKKSCFIVLGELLYARPIFLCVGLGGTVKQSRCMWAPKPTRLVQHNSSVYIMQKNTGKRKIVLFYITETLVLIKVRMEEKSRLRYCY